MRKESEGEGGEGRVNAHRAPLQRAAGVGAQPARRQSAVTTTPAEDGGKRDRESGRGAQAEACGYGRRLLFWKNCPNMCILDGSSLTGREWGARKHV